MQVQICVLHIKPIVFFDVFVAAALLDLKVPYNYWKRAGHIVAFFSLLLGTVPSLCKS